MQCCTTANSGLSWLEFSWLAKCICPESKCSSLRLWRNLYLYFQSRGIQEAKIKTGPLVFSHPSYASLHIELPNYFHGNRLQTDTFFLHWQWIYKPGIYEVSLLRDASGWERRAVCFWNNSRAAVEECWGALWNTMVNIHILMSPAHAGAPVSGEQIQCAVNHSLYPCFYALVVLFL